MKVYFAHPLSDYDTQFERRVLGFLEASGFAVENPNQDKHERAYRTLRDHGNVSDSGAFAYFTRLVHGCDAIVFVRMPSGSVGAGVYKEGEEAAVHGMPVYEVRVDEHGMRLIQCDRSPLPVLSIEETRAQLKTLYAAPNGGRSW